MIYYVLDLHNRNGEQSRMYYSITDEVTYEDIQQGMFGIIVYDIGLRRLGGCERRFFD